MGLAAARTCSRTRESGVSVLMKSELVRGAAVSAASVSKSDGCFGVGHSDLEKDQMHGFAHQKVQ